MDTDQKRPRTNGRIGLASILAIVVLTGACGLQSVTDDEGSAEVVFDDRAEAEPGDIEREPGVPGEVYGREATLVGFETVDAFNEIDSEGYVVLEVTVRNVGAEPAAHTRGDWTLELPDGRRIGTAPVEGQPQMPTGELDPDEEITAKVVFAVGESPGPFFAVYMPREHRNDTEERARVVWGFSVA